MGRRMRKGLRVVDWGKVMSDAIKDDRQYQKNSAVVRYVLCM